jgi:serine/threonine protein kinase
LQWNQRLDISHGVAAALIYLHTAYEQPLVHRDVKSANVLLDESMKPKVSNHVLTMIASVYVLFPSLEILVWFVLDPMK